MSIVQHGHEQCIQGQTLQLERPSAALRAAAQDPRFAYVDTLLAGFPSGYLLLRPFKGLLVAAQFTNNAREAGRDGR